MIRALALAVVALAGPATAQDWVDYELVMEQHADSVVIETLADGTTLRRLDLDDGTSIRCPGDHCFGSNDRGAPACLLAGVTEVYVMAELCPGAFAPGDLTTLAEPVETVGTQVAENAVAPRDWAVGGPRLLSRFRERRSGPDACEITAEQRAFLNQLSSPAMDASIVEVTAGPRLPAGNHCV